MKKYFLVLLMVAVMPGISSCQIGKDIQKGLDKVKIPGSTGGLTNDEIIAGLKEALNKGIATGSDKVSVVDGYFKNMAIKIIMPPDAQKVEKKLREIGMGAEVDKAILSMNRAAEQAAKDAKPIFVEAIRGMTVTDAVNILKGKDDEATQYLKRTTSAQLTAKFTPVIKNALDQTQATKYWKSLFDTYNKLPFVEHVNSDLVGYVTQKGLDGLFVMIAEEEGKIRKDPVARTSEILRKVFGQQ